MRVPLSWLSELTELDVDARDRKAVAELGRTFDGLGLVVEGIEYVGAGLDGVVAAKVVEIAPIEGADRIRRVLVEDGGDAPVEIVCGAWNFAVDDVVPLARTGTELPDGMVITRRKMRGVVSDGMLCSGRELGVAEHGEGLLLLDRAATPGAPVAALLGIVPDAVFDLAIEPNRPDCLSMLGIARDSAAKLGRPLHPPAPPVLQASGPPTNDLVSATVAVPTACPQLLVLVLEGVEVVASPAETARRLELAGMRPINSVVDASNLVMLELGQPTHPYDLDRLGAPGLTVRFARPGEALATLDGTERRVGSIPAPGGEAPVEDLLICDAADTPVGLAGVMGGASSEIAETTRRVLLEVAEFDPLTIGRTAARLGLRTEASARFWRGVDPLGLTRAAERFCELVTKAQVAAGHLAPVVSREPVHLVAKPYESRVVTLRPGRLNALLGTELAESQIVGLLAPIGFSAEPGAAGLSVTVPSFRPDATREVDLVEEVARHLGYPAIPLRERRSPSVGRLSDRQRLRRRLREALADLGADEAWTSSLVDPARELAAGRTGGGTRLLNPVVPQESILRTHLLPGLLGALAYNRAHRNPSLRLFELGDVFEPPASPGAPPNEREQVGLLLALETDDAASATQAWWSLAETCGLDDSAIVLEPLSAEAARLPVALGLHPSRAAQILAGGASPVLLGVVGEVDPGVLEAFDLGPGRVGWLALDLVLLVEHQRHERKATPVSRYPSSDVDLAFTLAQAEPAGRLATVLASAAGDLLEELRLIDVYRGPGLPEGTRGLTYRLRFCATDRTLTDAEVGALRAACIAAAESELSAQLRS